MTGRQRRALLDLLGLPHDLPADAEPTRSSVPVAELRSILTELPRPELADWLGPEQWLAGGAVLRWLCGTKARRGHTEDHDFYFPSVARLNAAARRFMDRGYRFRCFRSRRAMCQLCGRVGEEIPGAAWPTEFLPVRRVRCRTCGDFGGQDAPSLPPERLLPLTPELIAEHGIFALELVAPIGSGMVHLAAVAVKPTPYELVTGFDFSIVQFALDDTRLHFGPHAWTDLLRGRLRLEVSNDPLDNFNRLKKYRSRGFRPYLETVVRVAYHGVKALGSLGS
jgi:hypothetical protein